jgi:hypothetical protein
LLYALNYPLSKFTTMKNNNPTVTFNLSLDEANKIFKALSNLPFAEVYELIGKLNDQANQQLSMEEKPSQTFIRDASRNIDKLVNN